MERTVKMDLITKESEVLANIETLKQYLNGAERDFALDLLRHGVCFVITEENGRPFFAPSRFIGYRGNTRNDHLHNEEKYGGATNAALEGVFGSEARPSEALEQEYEKFCFTIGARVRKAPFGNERKFWDRRNKTG